MGVAADKLHKEQAEVAKRAVVKKKKVDKKTGLTTDTLQKVKELDACSTKNKGGRPPLYKDWLTDTALVVVKGWAMDGLTDAQIADSIGIAPQTLCEWKGKFPILREALKYTKDYTDRQVENALYKSATGYDYEEDVVTKTGEVVRVTKHMPANTTAQIFYLKNRKRDVWRDKIETEITGANGGAIQIQGLTEDDIDKRIAELKKVIAIDVTTVSDDNDRKQIATGKKPNNG